jgi:hypothetical protein
MDIQYKEEKFVGGNTRKEQLRFKTHVIIILVINGIMIK